MINCALKGDRNMDLHIKVWDFGVVCVFVIAKKVQIKHLHGVSSDNVCFFLQIHWKVKKSKKNAKKIIDEYNC